MKTNFKLLSKLLIILPVIILIVGCPRSLVKETSIKENAENLYDYDEDNEDDDLEEQIAIVNQFDMSLAKIAEKTKIKYQKALPLERKRPRHLNSDRENISICKRRAQVASSRNINTLVVSFESAGSYNENFTTHFYDYYDSLWEEGDQRRIFSLGSNLSRDLIAPNLHLNFSETDFLLFSEKNGANTVESCIETYRTILGPKLKINLIGISFGAGEALVLAVRLSEKYKFGSKGIIVDNLLTIDLRGTERLGEKRKIIEDEFQTPPNVKHHMNFGRFRAIESLFISLKYGHPGYRAKAADGFNDSVTVNHPMPTSAGHVTQIKTKIIQDFYREML